jgi:hypothetical protein
MALLFILLTGLYFIPAIVAAMRSHSQTVAILMLNLFLGWTFIGWIAALIWSVTSQSPQQVIIHNTVASQANGTSEPATFETW